jgi:hypothetical protein
MTALIIRNHISYNGHKIYTTQWKKNGLEKLTVTQLVKKSRLQSSPHNEPILIFSSIYACVSETVSSV